MQQFTLFENPTFRLERWGKGVSYALTHKGEGKVYHCQGDDALEFEADLGRIEEHAEGWPETCAALWDLYDLGATDL